MKKEYKKEVSMKKAFTLAEVLITLTIIGVIAALTIPNLIQSYKKHQVEVGVKEAYSILSNAIKMSETENGSTSEWNYEFINTDFPRNKILPYLKVTKTCGYVWNNNCFCQFSAINNSSRPMYADWIYFASLANGMSIGIQPFKYELGYIYIDIDGPNKGACKMGKDIFEFTVANKDNNYYKSSFGPGAFKAAGNGIGNLFLMTSLNDLLGTDSSVWGSCNINGTTTNQIIAGAQCAAAIAKNGWKIPDNYPVKKW